jgi:hypothetical protein
VKYTLQVAGEYTIDVQVQPDEFGPFFSIQSFPRKVICQITNAYPINTILTGEGVTDAIAGIVQSFTVTLFDIGNNRLQVGGDNILVEFDGTAQIEIFDHLDGSYLIKYRIEEAGTYALTVTTNGATTDAKTDTTVVVPNIPWSQTSSVSFDEEIDLGVEYTVDIVVVDLYENPVIVEQPVVLVIEGQGMTIFSTFSAVGLSTSEYTTTYTVPPGGADISNCGTYTLSSLLLI